MTYFDLKINILTSYHQKFWPKNWKLWTWITKIPNLDKFWPHKTNILTFKTKIVTFKNLNFDRFWPLNLNFDLKTNRLTNLTLKNLNFDLEKPQFRQILTWKVKCWPLKTKIVTYFDLKTKIQTLKQFLTYFNLKNPNFDLKIPKFRQSSTLS